MLMISSAVCALMTLAARADAACWAATANSPGWDGDHYFEVQDFNTEM
jgi:hypothetical protein